MTGVPKYATERKDNNSQRQSDGLEGGSIGCVTGISFGEQVTFVHEWNDQQEERCQNEVIRIAAGRMPGRLYIVPYIGCGELCIRVR
jgi:hypothetical protein